MGRRYAAAVHILVVEDDAALVRILRKSIESSGHTVETAGDGVAGLEAARAGRFDAIVLDLMLPKRTGFDVLAELRQMPAPRPRVLVLSARGREEDVTRGVKWSSSDESVCRVDDDGLAAVVGPGEGAVVAWYASQEMGSALELL